MKVGGLKEKKEEEARQVLEEREKNSVMIV